MGTMQCDRKGCDTVCCSRGNSRYYICYSCFNELVESGPATDLDDFMKSSSLDKTGSYERWNAVFPK